MSAYADSGFVVSLFLVETTSEAADEVFSAVADPVFLSELNRLEIRNALNLGMARGRFTASERDAAWETFGGEVEAGAFTFLDLDWSALLVKARELSDRHTPSVATRSLDLLHVAAALLLNADEFLSFDDRQRRVAEAEGLKVRP